MSKDFELTTRGAKPNTTSTYQREAQQNHFAEIAASTFSKD
jgi:hypothetical protein